MSETTDDPIGPQESTALSLEDRLMLRWVLLSWLVSRYHFDGFTFTELADGTTCSQSASGSRLVKLNRAVSALNRVGGCRHGAAL